MGPAERIILYGFVVIWTLIGIAAFVLPIVKSIIAHMKYEKVKGVCVRVDTIHGHDSEGEPCVNYKPVWEYYYNEMQYSASENESATFMNIPVGTERLIYVSPDNPEKIYVPLIRKVIFSIVFALVWNAFSVWIFLGLLN